MKIIKLVFVANGRHLALRGKPLLQESVEAWTYGPVIADLYHDFTRFGNSPIRGHALDIDILKGPDGRSKFCNVRPNIEDFTDQTQETSDLLDRIREIISSFSGIQLPNMTRR